MRPDTSEGAARNVIRRPAAACLDENDNEMRDADLPATFFGAYDHEEMKSRAALLRSAFSDIGTLPAADC